MTSTGGMDSLQKLPDEYPSPEAYVSSMLPLFYEEVSSSSLNKQNASFMRMWAAHHQINKMLFYDEVSSSLINKQIG
jgi:hypothetical protein